MLYALVMKDLSERIRIQLNFDQSYRVPHNVHRFRNEVIISLPGVNISYKDNTQNSVFGGQSWVEY